MAKSRTAPEAIPRDDIVRQKERELRDPSVRGQLATLRGTTSLASLVQRPAKQDDRAAIGPRARWRNLDDFALDMEDVSGAGRGRPAQLCSGPDNAAGERRTAVNIETHRD